MNWTISYSDSALDQLQRMDKPIARRIVDYMSQRVAVLNDPRERGRALTGTFSGLWRYRVGDCRIICDIQYDVQEVLVLRVGQRSQIYRWT